MKILFVHGLGATPFDCFPTFVRLRRLGYKTSAFSYFASFQSLDSINVRLLNRFAELAAEGAYAVIGHSLGGVLVRDILMRLPAGINQPKHLFLLGSPMIATRMNKHLSTFGVYRLLSGQCGQLVASDTGMEMNSALNRMTASCWSPNCVPGFFPMWCASRSATHSCPRRSN